MALIRALAAVAAVSFVHNVAAWNPELPPCLSPFQPFVYSGCFADTNGLALSFRSTEDQQNMTVEKCVAECKGNGYRYAGLEYYGICYCGQTVNGASLDADQCTFPCTGNSSETCGGDKSLSIYTDPTFPPTDDVDIDDYINSGCWTDESDLGRTLAYPQDQIKPEDLTPELCLSACEQGGYPFAGVEYGSECWCGVVIGNDTVSVPSDQCNLPCNGNSSATCGGRSRINIFIARDLESLEPCGYVPSASSSVVSSTSTTSTTTPYVVTSTTTTSTTSTTPSTTSTTTSSTTSTKSSTTSTTSSTTSTKSTTSTTSTKSTTTTKSTTSTYCPPTTTAKPPTTTSKPVTTTKPPTTTTKPTTSTTKTSSICIATYTIPPKCEYGCGNWCNKDLPDWDDDVDCKGGYASCKMQVAACFKNAGWPGSMDCFDYAEWCEDISKYCTSTCKKGKKGSCGKSDCFKNKPPKGHTPPKTTTSTYPCPTTTSKTTSVKTTSTKTTSTTTCIPSPTGICKQPTNSWYGYGPGKPVGGIELPILTCNDIKSDWPRTPFKLYTDSDSRKCGSYTPPQVPDACADACKEQYDDCKDVYAEGCRQYSHRRSAAAYGAMPEVARRWYWNDNYNGATNKCKAQYDDCLSQNKGVNAGDKCKNYGSGW